MVGYNNGYRIGNNISTNRNMYVLIQDPVIIITRAILCMRFDLKIVVTSGKSIVVTEPEQGTVSGIVAC